MAEECIIKCSCKGKLSECKGQAEKLYEGGNVYQQVICPFAYYDFVNRWEGYRCNRAGKYNSKIIKVTIEEIKK